MYINIPYNPANTCSIGSMHIMMYMVIYYLQYIVNVRLQYVQMEAHAENWDLPIVVYVQLDTFV